MTGSDFVQRLSAFAGERPTEKVMSFFKGDDGETQAVGVQFGTVFKLAKEFTDLPLEEVNQLLDSPYYEVRMGAVSIMDFKARKKRTGEDVRKALYELYLQRHDRLNNWDFVDRAAPHVVGGYLFDKSRDVLYQLAREGNVWEKRTAIVSTYFFIKNKQLEDTFALAEILLPEKNEYISKAVGSWLREAGKKDEARLRVFLDEFATSMQRVSLRYAVEKFSPELKAHYMKL